LFCYLGSQAVSFRAFIALVISCQGRLPLPHPFLFGLYLILFFFAGTHPSPVFLFPLSGIFTPADSFFFQDPSRFFAFPPALFVFEIWAYGFLFTLSFEEWPCWTMVSSLFLTPGCASGPPPFS